MFDKSTILDICNAHDVVLVTFTKANGEVTTRRTSFQRVPNDLSGKGVRAFSENQVNLFDIDKGNWITAKVDAVSEVKPE
jgi:hypothetical protein